MPIFTARKLKPAAIARVPIRVRKVRPVYRCQRTPPLVDELNAGAAERPECRAEDGTRDDPGDVGRGQVRLLDERQDADPGQDHGGREELPGVDRFTDHPFDHDRDHDHRDDRSEQPGVHAGTTHLHSATELNKY
ncbi:hypothetical protein [Streptomyces kanamyceticus]|uniref:hypothetical protein n=1 Tax=Streptomyces kanamyceticus TaxID=1967 RepID=UPI0037DD51CF